MVGESEIGVRGAVVGFNHAIEGVVPSGCAVLGSANLGGYVVVFGVAAVDAVVVDGNHFVDLLGGSFFLMY
jgi:hypothetical protein